MNNDQIAVRMIQCPTVLLHPKAKPPTRGTAMAAGHDICCVAGTRNLEDRSKWSDTQLMAWDTMERNGYVNLQPGQGFLFRTGFAQAIREDYVCLLWDRSGMGAIKSVGRLGGVIDPDYRGEWFVRLINHSSDAVIINVGDKIVQGIYQERVTVDCPIVETLPATVRGSAAFGSTDQPKKE